MKEIKKKVSSFINISIVSALLLILLGIIFLVAPDTSLDMIRWIIAIFCLVAGAYLIISDLTRRVFPLFSTSFFGVVLLILGLVFAVQPSVMNIFPIALGVWFVASAVASGRFAVVVKSADAGIFAIISTILSLICGLLLIINPWGGQIAMVTFSGIMMIIYGVSSLVDLFIIKHNIDELAKSLKK